MSGPTHDPALYRHRDVIPITRALVSVSDKTGLIELAQALADAGVEIVSTGGSASAIAAAGIPVTEVGDVTGYPESLDGRVRTLHPAIHSGLLADLRLESHESELAASGIKPFELVVSNLYPFVETIAAGVVGDAAIEQIDIGGPAMVRASAKNHANIAVITSPDSYPQVLKALAARRHDSRAAPALRLRGLRPHGGVRRRGRRPGSPSRSAPSDDRIARDQRDARCVAALRRELAPEGRALRRAERSRHRAGDPAARQGDVVQQLRGCRRRRARRLRLRRARRRDHQARQPVWHRRRPRLRRPDRLRPRPGARVRPALGLRRSDRREPRDLARGGRVDQGHLHRGRRRARLRPRSARAAARPRRTCACCSCPSDFERPTTEVKQISGGYLVQDTDNYDDFDSSGWTLVSGAPARTP